MAPFILILGTRRRRVVSLTPLSFYCRGWSHRYPLGSRLGRRQSPSARFGDEKNLLSPAENRTTIPSFTDRILVTIPNELYRPPTLTVCECIWGGEYRIYLAYTLLCKKLAVPGKTAHC